MREVLPWVPVLGALFAFLCLLAALRAGKRRRLVDNLPTSKTTGVFIGLVEVKGTVECDAPLTSFLAACRCSQYAWSVEEEWERTVTETYTDSDGKTQTRTRTESGWSTVASGGEAVPFYLQDDCGAVRIQPEGAELEPLETFNERCTRLNPLYYDKGPLNGIMDSTGRRRFRETAFPLHTPIYVMGQARERQDAVAAEIAADPAAPMFLISTRSEEEISSGFGWSLWGWLIFGALLLVGSLGLRGSALNQSFDHTWPWFALALFLYGGAAVIGWVWMVFNGLVDLRQRVRQGWSQVDVQLKRRHDLLPQLVATVSGLRDHEARVQTQLAALRAQQTATPPGAPGADYAGCARVLVAVQEAYPELTAEPSFLALQQSLVDTEQRIALARGYFNEIATHYNTRLEQIPDRFIAALASLQSQPLLLATDFERAPVDVNFAS